MNRYLCDQCTHYWTTDEPVTECPECGNPATAKRSALMQAMTWAVESLTAAKIAADDTIAALTAENDQLRASLAAADELIAWHGEGVR